MSESFGYVVTVSEFDIGVHKVIFLFKFGVSLVLAPDMLTECEFRRRS